MNICRHIAPFAVAAIFAFGGIFPLCAGNSKVPAIQRVKHGEIVYGDNAGIARAMGKPTVLYYWDMTCLPCMVHMGEMSKFADEVNRSGGVFFSIHHGRDLKKETIRDFATKRKLPFSIAMGGNGPGMIGALPKLFVFNAAGDVVYQGALGMPAVAAFRQQLK